MTKKALKVILIFLMILGVAFSILNIIPSDANAAMKEEQLYFFWGPGPDDYVFFCKGEGQGCYTVTP